MKRLRLLVGLLAGPATLLAAGCSGSPPRTGATNTTVTATTAPVTSAAPSGPPRADATGTVWLCRPGLADDPCAGTSSATVVPAGGARTVEKLDPATNPAFDCFYVYPTVSIETGNNADLAIQPAEVAAAVTQASLFSQVCRIWAPMYRQATLASLVTGAAINPAVDAVAYQSLLAGWDDYLAHFNDGRPVIFLGHSQGAAMLIRLLSSQVDPEPALRERVVSAIIAGGNVAVPTGQLVGSTFQHLPLCSTPIETGCVIAYSTFPSQPPTNSLFGRPGQGVSYQSSQAASAHVEVACVNPAALSGGTADLVPYFTTASSSPPPPAVRTRWVTYPGLYTASCQQGGGASWLQVTATRTAGDNRPVVTQSLGPTWGFHVDDINLALGNLVQDVRRQEAAYRAVHR
jgi:Protein of unknown function (DUF3089)